MARTALTVDQLSANGGKILTAPLTVPAAATGVVVASPGGHKLLLTATNAAGSGSVNCIIRASGYQGTPNGAANSSYVTDQYQPFAQASVGDLTVAVGFGTSVQIGPLDTDRFSQPDGTLLVDFSSPTSMTVSAVRLPFVGS
jgi:hypothetical protein